MPIIVSNYPYITENSFRSFVRGEPGPTMTTNGVVGKTFLLLGLLALGAVVGGYFVPAAKAARSLWPWLGVGPLMPGNSSYTGL